MLIRKTFCIPKLSVFLSLIGIGLSSYIHAQEIATPDGYAGYMGTTGGGDVVSMNVSDSEALTAALNTKGPKVIKIYGRIRLSGSIVIDSNTTLVGFSPSSGLYGGAVLITGDNNIVQNLTLGPAPGDVMEISGARNIFITKCTFFDSGDELFSIVLGSDYVTVSWCKFYFENQTDHSFAHLIGNDDSAYGDRGRLHVTMHHNWYADKILERMPRVRYGYVHIYNNYYNSENNHYCIGTGTECHIRVENSVFDYVNQIWKDYNGVSTSGILGWYNISLDNCTMPTYISNSYPVFNVPYNYVLDPVDKVIELVTNGSGNVFDEEYLTNNLRVSVISPADNSTKKTGSSITINAEVSDTEGSIAKVCFYSDTVLLSKSYTEPYTYTIKSVAAGDYKLWAMAENEVGEMAISDMVTMKVSDNVSSKIIKDFQIDIMYYPGQKKISINTTDLSDLIGIQLIDMKGRSIKQYTSAFNLDVSDIKPGVYVVRLVCKDGIIGRKIKIDGI